MIALFYDRKNKCQVRSDELHLIKLVREVWCGNSQEPEEKYPGTDHLQKDILGSIGYKSPKCPSYCNWDFWCNISDLVFIDLTEESEK